MKLGYILGKYKISKNKKHEKMKKIKKKERNHSK